MRKGQVTLVVTEEQVSDPNGLTFSPDYKKLYVVSTGRGPGDTGPGGRGELFVFDVAANNTLSNQKLFTDFMIDGVKARADGVRCDVDGNVWCSSNAGRAVGYSGVTVVDAGRRSCSAASACPKCAATSASAVRSAIACSWPRVSRSTRSTSTHRGSSWIGASDASSSIAVF